MVVYPSVRSIILSQKLVDYLFEQADKLRSVDHMIVPIAYAFSLIIELAVSFGIWS